MNLCKHPLCFLITIFIFAIVCSCSGKRKNYCDWPEGRTCQLDRDDPAHFDPYYNGHLCENFDPQQVDFSKEYLEARTKAFADKANQMDELSRYDFSEIWPTGDWQQNGVLGQNYQRIQFHIDSVSRSTTEPTVYFVRGKSKVNKNICDFKGKIKLLKAFKTESVIPSSHKLSGELFASYEFFEDSTQSHSGIFKGITECAFYLDSLGNQMKLDETEVDFDGYWNRSFIGIWTEFKSKQVKKCIWGDYRLPFTFDFDSGDGVLMVSEKYAKNGWESFVNHSELTTNPSTKKIEIINKWWIAP